MRALPLYLALMASLVVVSSTTCQAQDDAAPSEHPLVTDVKSQLGKRSGDRPFIMVIDLTCVKGKRAHFIAAMSNAIVNTRKEEGSMRYQLISDPADSTKFQMFEQWKNMDAFMAHMKQPYIGELEEKLADLLVGDLELKVMVPVPLKK